MQFQKKYQEVSQVLDLASTLLITKYKYYCQNGKKKERKKLH